DDCNGIVDDVPGIGTACAAAGVNTTGVCTATYSCNGAAGPGPRGLTCAQGVTPSPEPRDGADGDCDGAADDHRTGVGAPGRAAGVWECVAGGRACAGGVAKSSATCNGADDDCNGAVDDVPGIGNACSGGGVNTAGVCTAGYACTGTPGPGPGGLTCTQGIT